MHDSDFWLEVSVHVHKHCFYYKSSSYDWFSVLLTQPVR